MASVRTKHATRKGRGRHSAGASASSTSVTRSKTARQLNPAEHAGSASRAAAVSSSVNRKPDIGPYASGALPSTTASTAANSSVNRKPGIGPYASGALPSTTAFPFPVGGPGSQKISNEGEEEIIELLKLWSSRWLPLPHQSQVSEMANAWLKAVNEPGIGPMTSNWPPSMSKRHPDFKRWWKKGGKDQPGREADPKAEKKRLGKFMAALTRCIEKNHIPKSNIYAVSNSGYSMRIYRDSQVTVPRPRKKSKDSRQVASVISAFPSDGKPLSPYVIFKRQGDPSGSGKVGKLRASWNRSGWADDEGILRDWLEKIFEPETNPKSADATTPPARLILLDSGTFDITPEFFLACLQRNVHLWAFPSGSQKLSHTLESALTSTIASKYTERMKWRFHRKDKAFYIISEKKFCKHTKSIFGDTDLIPLLGEGWKLAGLVPFNLERLNPIVECDATTPSPLTQRTRSVSEHHDELSESSDEAGTESEDEEPRKSRLRSQSGVNTDSAIILSSSEDETPSDDADESGSEHQSESESESEYDEAAFIDEVSEEWEHEDEEDEESETSDESESSDDDDENHLEEHSRVPIESQVESQVESQIEPQIQTSAAAESDDNGELPLGFTETSFLKRARAYSDAEDFAKKIRLDTLQEFVREGMDRFSRMNEYLQQLCKVQLESSDTQPTPSPKTPTPISPKTPKPARGRQRSKCAKLLKTPKSPTRHRTR